MEDHVGGACSKQGQIKRADTILFGKPKMSTPPSRARLGSKDDIKTQVKRTHRTDEGKVTESRLPLPPYMEKKAWSATDVTQEHFEGARGFTLQTVQGHRKRWTGFETPIT
jgi:hypothetical protein